MNIVQSHPGSREEINKVESEAVSLINTIITDKSNLSDSFSDFPEKQNQQQYVFKPVAQIKQVIQSDSKYEPKQTHQNRPNIITKKSNSFITSQNADEKILEHDTPQLRNKSQSNLNEIQLANEIQLEKQIQLQEQRNSYMNQKQKIRHQAGPSFGGGDSKIISPNSIPQLNNNSSNSNIFYFAPHHHHQGSNVSNFSFQQIVLPQQIQQKKSESNSPPANFGLYEDLTQDVIKLEEDEKEDIQYLHYHQKKLPSIESNISNNTNNQSVIYYPTNQLPTQPTKFQLSLYQTDNMLVSCDQSQINMSDQNNNTHKSSGELNEDEPSKIYANNILSNPQINSQVNIISETDTRDLSTQNRRKQKHSYVQVNYGDLPEEIDEDDYNDDIDNIDEIHKNDKLNINQIQLIGVNKDLKKKSFSVSEERKNEIKIKVQTPQGRIVQKSPNNKETSKNQLHLEIQKNKMNFLDQKNALNLRLQKSMLNQVAQKNINNVLNQKSPNSQKSQKKNQMEEKSPQKQQAIGQNIQQQKQKENGFLNVQSELIANSIIQQKDEQSNLELMPIQSNLLFSSNLFESSVYHQDDQLQVKDISNKRDKSKSKSQKQQKKQKNTEVEKPYRQEKIMQRVRQFLDILKLKSSLRSHSMIKKKIIEIINDLVYPNKQNIQTRTLQQQGNRYSSFRLSRLSSKIQSSLPQQQMLYIFYKKLLNTPLFHPQSLFKLTWDFIHVCIILLIVFYIPIQMVTGKNIGILIEAEVEWCRVIILIFLFFIIDILISFNTGIYDQGIVNENRKDVSLTYIKGQFILDIIFSVSIMKTYYNMESGSSFFTYVCCAFLFFKFFTLRRIINNFTDILLSIRNNTKLYYFIELICLLITILFVGHIFACAFWYISEMSQHGNNTWMKELGIANKGWETKYLYSIYFSITTMITVGYGDITPQNTSEVIMGIVCMILSSAVFGYSLNTIGVIIKEIQKDGHYIKEQMSLVNRYLNSKNISRDLKVSVRTFLQYKMKTKNLISLEQEKYILDELSTQLREKLITEENINIMKQCKSTFSSFSEECLQKLAIKMKQFRFSKNEMIFEEEQIDEDPIFYFIQRGSIELFVESVKSDYNFTTVALLQEGSSLGEISIYVDKKNNVSAKAIEMSILKTLSRQDILDVLKFFPKDYEKFCFFKDEILFNEQTQQIQKSCFNCQSQQHTIDFCPQLHYVPDKEKVILKHIFSLDQSRKPNKNRSNSRKFNAVIYQPIIQQIQEKYISQQKEETIEQSMESEIGEIKNLFSSEQDESIAYQANRISSATTMTNNKMVNQPYQNMRNFTNNNINYNNISTNNINNNISQNNINQNNISALSGYKNNNLNVLNKSKNINKSGFYPQKTSYINDNDQSRRSRQQSLDQNENSPSTLSSHSDSILSHSYINTGNNQKQTIQQQSNNFATSTHSSNKPQIPNQQQFFNQGNIPSQQNNFWLFKQTEALENNGVKDEINFQMNNQREEEYDEQTGDDKLTQNHSNYFKWTDSVIQKNNQHQILQATGIGANDPNNHQGYTNFLTPKDRGRVPSTLDRGRLPSNFDRAREQSIVDRGRQPSQINTNSKPPPPQSLNRSTVRNLSLKVNTSNQQGNILNNPQQNIYYNDLNISPIPFPHTTTNLLEVPKNSSVKKESSENIKMNNSQMNKSRGENDYNQGRQNSNQILKSGNTFPHNGVFLNQNTNFLQSMNNNTAYFSQESRNVNKQQKNNQDKNFIDKNLENPFQNNEVYEENSIMSKYSAINIQKVNSMHRNSKSTQKSFLQQQQQQMLLNAQNNNEDFEQLNKNINKFMYVFQQDKSPNKNIIPFDGVSRIISNSPIPRKNTTSTIPQSNNSQSTQRKGQNFTSYIQTFANQNQVLPPIGVLQSSTSQLHHQKDNSSSDQHYSLSYIQPQQFLRRRKHIDDAFQNYILQQNESPHQQQILIPIKSMSQSKDYKALGSMANIYSAGNTANNNTPVNHKQHQKNMVMQRHIDVQFTQKLAKYRTLRSILNTNVNNEIKPTIEDIIEKEVLQDQAKEFTYYYPRYNLSQIIPNIKTLKVTLCNAFTKYTLYNYKNYQKYPYKNQSNNPQLEQIKQFKSDLQQALEK